MGQLPDTAAAAKNHSLNSLIEWERLFFFMRFSMRIPRQDLEKIDRLRGLSSRGSFILGCLEAEIEAIQAGRRTVLDRPMRSLAVLMDREHIYIQKAETTDLYLDTIAKFYGVNSKRNAAYIAITNCIDSVEA